MIGFQHQKQPARFKLEKMPAQGLNTDAPAHYNI